MNSATDFAGDELGATIKRGNVQTSVTGARSLMARRRLVAREDEPTNIVQPSGSELATAAAPILVPAPGLFSITSCWAQMPDRRSAVMRATVSVDPPGAYGTTIRTGRLGQAWANAARPMAGAIANVVASATKRRRSTIVAVFNRHPPDE